MTLAAVGDSFAFLLGLNMRMNDDDQGVTPAFSDPNPKHSPFAYNNFARRGSEDVIDMPLQMDRREETLSNPAFTQKVQDL